MTKAKSINRLRRLSASNNAPVEVTPAMIDAGVAALYREYDGVFDASENDAVHFVMRLYQAMVANAPPDNDPALVHLE